MFSEDGLSKLWNELVRDGEIQAANRDKKEEEAENVKERKSPFDVFLEEWTWGQVCSERLEEGGREREIVVTCLYFTRNLHWSTCERPSRR